ncbi:MAG: acyltransferase [Flavobacteriaceae bacterium]|jgi:peptidoglycan/LPS O-acetylase OafA/YrhL|nr:acyltransferase [Flavobacteriaceae bacterium]
MYIDYKHRIFGLDVIRAIAILLVLISHSTFLLFPTQNNLVLTLIRFFGTIGVDLFFVLSGFLIGRIILKQLQKEKISFNELLYFWIRRWFRTLPNYFFVLILNIILFFILYGEVIQGIGYYFVFLQNFASEQPDFFTESWSLSIEEYAYVIGPLLLYVFLFLFKKVSKKKLFLIVTLLVILLITFLRYKFHLHQIILTDHEWSQQLRKVVIYRMDSIYYGFIGAYISMNYNSFWLKFKNWSLISSILLFFGMHLFIFWFKLLPNNTGLFYNVFYLPLISISLLMVFPVFSSWVSGHLLKKTMTSISILSYAIYLINYSIVLLTIQYFFNLDDASNIFKFLVLILFWFLTFSLSYLLYLFFEKPTTDFRNLPIIKQKFTN